MSDLDPFTKKLLERTQARKELRNKRQAPNVPKQQQISPVKRQAPCARAPKSNDSPVKKQAPSILKSNAEPGKIRTPLSEKNYQCDSHLQADFKTNNKRRSSEGIDSSFEKKVKTSENDSSDDNLFNPRATNRFVVPSNVGRTPAKVNTGSSLQSRLASLNQNYNEKFSLDLEEQQRQDETEVLRQQRNKERMKKQEEERTQRIQERIFGKNHAATCQEEVKPATETKEILRSHSKPIPNEISARKPLHNRVKTTAPQPKEQKLSESEDEKNIEIEKRKKQEEKVKQAILDTKSKEEEQSASVGDKKSIFESKMQQEKEAREKEIETERRLRQKTPRNKLAPGNEKKEVDQPVPAKRQSVSYQEIRRAVSVPGEEIMKQPDAKKESGMLKHAHATSVRREEKTKSKVNARVEAAFAEIVFADVSVQKASIPTSVHTPIKEDVKNYTGDMNSPQPIDYTDDTIISDSKAFDISEILRVADEEAVKPSPTKLRNDRTPMRSSTMKVQLAETPVIVKPIIDIDVTVSIEQEEKQSKFAKQICAKKEALKTAKPIKKYNEIKIKPQKPPRNNQAQTDFPPTYQEFIETKKNSEQLLPAEANTIASPTKLKEPRKKLRRSVSFSEGTPTKSGYNHEESSKYNAYSMPFDKPDIIRSKRDQIQNLLEEAAYQQNIVLQTSQALNVAESSNEDKRGLPEVIEGERLLLLATEKRTVCLEEVRELKETDSVQFLNSLDEVPPCKATLALTEIKLPLHHDFVAALRDGRMDLGVFHFVLIFSAGSKHVYSTKVVSNYDQMDGHSLIINSNIFMRNVPHDFVLTVRVFGLHTKKNDHTSKVRKTNSNSQSPGNLKNLFSKRNKDDDYTSCASPQTVFRTSNFKLIGETKINLGLLGNGAKHVLTKVPSNCPLDGFVQFRVGCKPEFAANATGFLTILEDVGGYTAWNRRWCSLKDSKILYWRYPDDEDTKEPLGCIDLRYCSEKVVGILPRDICARPHTFELPIKRVLQADDETNLITQIEGKFACIRYWLCADNKDDRITWMNTINKQLSDTRAWLLKKTTNKPKEVLTQLGKPISV